ncbi:MAG: lipid-A-disaccharide synthase [Bacteroidales bacterium]|jgi:lipid-A-disaccharide synthase|nr:lipid-A-disaccharide synthase [Bacteroidales bacterium]
MKYYIVAGEASGDLHASNLMYALKKQDEQGSFRCFGGDLMLAQGGTLVKHYREMAFMGFIPVLLNIRKIMSNMALCKKDICAFSPDVVILVDYPGFNMQIAKFVKTKLHIPVCYYISPKIWAWKEYRIKSIRKYVDKMLSILPFEVAFYAKHRYSVDYVGNPTVDEIAGREFQTETFLEFICTEGLPEKPIIALLPGSRNQEISANLPVMLHAVQTFTDYQCVVAGAPGIEPEFYRNFADVPVIAGKTYRLLQQASLALVTSGTATLETALLRIPQIVCYGVGGGRFTYWMFRTFLHVDYISLVNLIAGKEVVKELIAHLFSVKNLAHEAACILHNDLHRQEILEGYNHVIRALGASGAPENAAKSVMSLIESHS